MKAFVEAGVGITLGPREFVAPELELGLLAAVPCVEPKATAGIGYAYDPQQERPPVVATRTVLEDQLRDLTATTIRT
jgi:DNA-binding transcriptional LysR family regulator